MQPPYATDPVEVSSGKILFSYASQVENQDYALYTINLDGTSMQLIYDTPGKMDLNAELLTPKLVPTVIIDPLFPESDELPPTIDPATYFKNGGFRFDCANVFTNGDIDQPMTDAPPITKNTAIKFFLNFQRQNAQGLDTPILLTSHEIQYTGQLNFDFAPGDVSMFEQIVDSTGKVLQGSKGQVAHVAGLNFGRSGTGTKCVGCHAGHTTINAPSSLTEAQFINTSTSSHVTQSSFLFINDTNQYPGSRVVDRKARNDSLKVNWVAAGVNNEFVQLDWDFPIDVRRISLYNIKPNPLTSTNIQVNDCEIIMYLQGTQVADVPSTGILSVNGTTISMSSLTKIDRMKVIVKNFTGLINGQSAAGLAEVETNAKISFYEVNGIHQISSIAGKFSLSQNYPNPFNPTTKIKYTIPQSSAMHMMSVQLKIYNITGRLVSTLINEFESPGTYEVDFNASNIASGVYFYRLTAGDNYTDVKKMIVLK
jgi:hypothetical protein